MSSLATATENENMGILDDPVSLQPYKTQQECYHAVIH